MIHDIEHLPFSPNYEAYATLYNQGLIRLVTVREDNKMIGYFMVVLHVMPHSKDVLTASTDSLFLLKEYRKGDTAYKMFSFMEDYLKSISVKQLSVHTKIKQPFDSLCESLDMEYIERHYMKYLGD